MAHAGRWTKVHVTPLSALTYTSSGPKLVAATRCVKSLEQATELQSILSGAPLWTQETSAPEAKFVYMLLWKTVDILVPSLEAHKPSKASKCGVSFRLHVAPPLAEI